MHIFLKLLHVIYCMKYMQQITCNSFKNICIYKKIYAYIHNTYRIYAYIFKAVACNLLHKILKSFTKTRHQNLVHNFQES